MRPEPLSTEELRTLGLPTETPPPEPHGGLSIPAPIFLAGHQGEEQVQWLVRDVWAAEAVGFLGGEPKLLKSWVGNELALSVSAGVPAFGLFEPELVGPVLVVQEESRSFDFARRLRMLARGHGLELEDLGNLHLSSQPGLLLDDDEGRTRLAAEIGRLEPRLVVLDPLVRMHSGDEDRAKEMRPVLRFLRRLQADHGCAVAVVHHLSKLRDGLKVRPGQRLRGTGDFHALVDSALYFDAKPGVQAVAVTVEHREAPAPEPFLLHLEDDEQGGVRLRAEVGTLADVEVLSALSEVEAVLRPPPEALSTNEVIGALKRRAQVVRAALKRLESLGRPISTSAQRPDALGRERRVTLWAQVRPGDSASGTLWDGSRPGGSRGDSETRVLHPYRGAAGRSTGGVESVPERTLEESVLVLLDAAVRAFAAASAAGNWRAADRLAEVAFSLRDREVR